MSNIKMAKIDNLKTIFNLFLCFLSEKGMDVLLNHCRKEPNGIQVAEKFKKLLELSENELQEMISRYGDEEDKITYINIFLWKQKLGKIDKSRRLKYDFEEPSNARFVHRHMVENGYEGIGAIGYKLGGENIITTYDSNIENLLGFQKKPGFTDDDYFSWLAGDLNTIGPKIKSFQQLPEVMDFVEYILCNFKRDKRVESLSLTSFTMLVFDLSYPPEKTWPVYKELLHRNAIVIFDYAALLLGIRMYGDIARNELRDMEIPGGGDLLDELASN